MLSDSSTFELPYNVWVTQAAASDDQQRVAMLLFRGSDTSIGLWSYGCLIAELDGTGGGHMKVAMTQDSLPADGRRRDLLRIEDISDYPIVQFSVGTSEAQGGKVQKRSERWNIFSSKLAK